MLLKPGLEKYLVEINKLQVYFKCKFNPASDEVVLFVHGLACSSDTFRNVLDKDYFPDKSIILLDLIGFGKSSRPENFPYSLESQAEMIESLLAEMPTWKINIVAHSMGGAICLLFKQDTISKIKSFSNVEGNLVSEDCGILSREIISVSYKEYRDNIFLKQVNEFKDHHQLRFHDSHPFAVHKSAQSLVKYSDSGELLKNFINLNCRKCYFFGEENQDMPILEKLNSITKYIISASGHGMTTENPVEFYNKLSDFIYERSC